MQISDEQKQNIYDLNFKKADSEYAWVKTVITAISTILGLIIALKDKNSHTYNEHIAFVVAVVSNGLCVLCGLLFLCREADIFEGLRVNYIDNIFLVEKNDKSNGAAYDSKRIFSFLKKLFFVLLFSSIISLIVYSVYTDRVEKPKEKFETEFFKIE